MTPDGSFQILSQTAEHAKRLCDMLERQAAELAADNSMDPLAREEGLRAIRRTIDSARRLAARAQEAVGREESD